MNVIGVTKKPDRANTTGFTDDQQKAYEVYQF